MVAGIGAGQIAKMVAALVEGDDNLIDKIVSDKLEKLGEQFLMQTLAGPFGGGGAARIADALQTGGLSEFNRLGENWLRGAVPGRSQFESKILNLLNTGQNLRRRIHGQHSPRTAGAWTRTDWAGSRDDWLDNHWKHDWRSQPRDERGRWVPGRLDYIAVSLQYRGRRAGRVKRKQMKLRRMARRRGRTAARKLLKGMGKKHGR